MSGWTIAHIKGLPDCNIEEPVEGEVTLAKPPETRNPEYGPSQFFILKDDTGEIAVSFSPPKPDSPFQPVERGDRVRIQAMMGGKGKLSGAKKTSYTKDGKRVPKITVYGNRLTNLSHSPAPAAQPPMTGAGSGAQTLPEQLFGPILDQKQAVDLYWQIFESVAGKLSVRTPDVGGVLDFIAQAEGATLTVAQGATAELFRAVIAGRVSLSHPPASQKRDSRSTTTHDDPFEGLLDGDDDIPF